MSGPIIRTGTSKKYGDGWDEVFGGGASKAKAAAKKAAPKKAAKKAAKKAPKKK